MNFKLILIIVLSALAVIFVAQNVEMIEISFFYWKASMSSALLIFFTLTIGFILGWSIHSYIAYRKSRDVFEYLH